MSGLKENQWKILRVLNRGACFIWLSEFILWIWLYAGDIVALSYSLSRRIIFVLYFFMFSIKLSSSSSDIDYKRFCPVIEQNLGGSLGVCAFTLAWNDLWVDPFVLPDSAYAFSISALKLRIICFLSSRCLSNY